MFDSSKTATDSWEIWIFAPGEHREPVEECGLFRERGDANRMASRLRDWLHLGQFTENLLDNAGDEYDRTCLLTMREYLHDQCIDPAEVTVAVVERGAVPDSEVTATEPPRLDHGHRVRGPRRDVVHIRGMRRF